MNILIYLNHIYRSDLVNKILEKLPGGVNNIVFSLPEEVGIPWAQKNKPFLYGLSISG